MASPLLTGLSQLSIDIPEVVAERQTITRYFETLKTHCLAFISLSINREKLV